MSYILRHTTSLLQILPRGNEGFVVLPFVLIGTYAAICLCNLLSLVDTDKFFFKLRYTYTDAGQCSRYVIVSIFDLLAVLLESEEQFSPWFF